MKPKLPRTCPTCRLDGGWHYDDEGNARRCGNWLAAELHDEAVKLTEEGREQAREAARRIVSDAAHGLPEFSANNCRLALDAAQVPGSVVGGAFRWAFNQGLIKKTGRKVMSDEDTTRHEIDVWQSLVYGKRIAS
jgi:hypothetical protein